MRSLGRGRSLGQSGRTQFIQLHVDMDQNLSLREAHDLAERIERGIRQAYPAADVIIHQDPVAVGPSVPVSRPEKNDP